MAKTIHLHIHGRARVSTSDSGDWEESKHKRDKSGQFSSTGGGGGAAKAAPAKSSAPSKEPASAPAASEADIRKKYAHLSPEQLSSTRGANKTEQRIINKMAVENVKPAANAVPGQRGLPPAAAGWQGKPMTATQSVTAPGGSASPMRVDPISQRTSMTSPPPTQGSGVVKPEQALANAKRSEQMAQAARAQAAGFRERAKGSPNAANMLKRADEIDAAAAEHEADVARWKKQATQSVTAPGGAARRPQDVYAEHRKDAGAKGQAALDLVAKAKTSTDPKVVQEALTMVEAAWQAHKNAGEAFSKIPYPGANDAGAHHAERTQAYSKLAESMHQRLNALTNPAKSKGVSQARVDTTKGNHKPGWMLRADPELAAKFKAAEARQAERKAIK